jgi:hypothetical protein
MYIMYHEYIKINLHKNSNILHLNKHSVIKTLVPEFTS